VPRPAPARSPALETLDPEDRPKAVIVGVRLPGIDAPEHRSSIQELARLATTLGLDVVGCVVQKRSALARAAVVGEGKLRELAAWTGGSGVVPSAAKKKTTKAGVHAAPRVDDDDADDDLRDDEALAEDASTEAEAVEADAPDDDGEGPGFPTVPPRGVQVTTVLVDHELSPSQARNLERATGAEVLDRTAVILAIFHRHARTREARLQVEIARLGYLAPRLREGVGGGDRVRGGVGGKGAGESALELDRRKIRDRIAELRDELAAIERDSGTRRKRRADQATVALVGYTNAGKSSLMRALTGSEVYVADKLFATLDTTVRPLHPESRPRVLVSDTVGFIKQLPHDLVASFRSTLEEAEEAHLLLHVVDASDPAFRAQLAVTEQVLAELPGASQAAAEGEPDAQRRLLVLNKMDRVDAPTRAALEAEFPSAFFMSARDPADVARLRARIVANFEERMEETTLFFPYAEGRRVAEVHAAARVLEESYDEHGTHLRVRAPRDVLARLRRAE
jgi:GTP-binding protein HflX